MGLGKAQKQARNLEIKMAKKRQRQTEQDNEYQKELDQVASMDNDRSYSLTKNGKPVLNGIWANARFWKVLYGLPTE